MVALGVDELVGHVPGLGGDFLQVRQLVPHRVIADPLDHHRTVHVVPAGVVRGLLAHLARLAGVHVGHRAGKRALQIAEGVGAHPLDAQPLLHGLRQFVRQSAAR